MLRIDGSTHSGSGTIVRYAAALATVRGVPLRIDNIRAKRNQPGLRPQHLTALRACCDLSRGRLEGDQVNAQEIHYWPGQAITGGDYQWNIGTAGSATMLAFTLIAPALHAQSACRFTIIGGLFQDFAPTAFHLREVLAPLLKRMGAEIDITIVQPGYVPKGQGCLTLSVKPLRGLLQGLELLEQGEIGQISGIALASHLNREKVSERMAARCREVLAEKGYRPDIAVADDASAVQPGAALALWAQTSTGCILGADQAGKRGRRSEAIAEHVCRSLLEDVAAGATVDRFMADQLILFAALAEGATTYHIPRMTGHVESNLWLIREILGADSQLRGHRLTIEGVHRQQCS